jgi:single-strand selective monofunctional uracil DNA glycosylase
VRGGDPAAALIAAAERLRDALRPWVERAPAGPVEYVLHPLDYAWELHRDYLRRWTRPGVEAVLVGMNPGPWGMCQTGVPFGTPDLVRELLGLEGRVRPPARTHPDRPVHGLDCPRNEVSGQRLWGGVRDCFGGAEPFFRRFFALNYCPLAFQAESGANLTPDKLPAAWLGDMLDHCDRHLAAAVRALGPRTVIGVGAWATERARRALAAEGLGPAVGTILHPSPASPAANRGWLPRAREQLAALGHPWPEPARPTAVAPRRRRG